MLKLLKTFIHCEHSFQKLSHFVENEDENWNNGKRWRCSERLKYKFNMMTQLRRRKKKTKIKFLYVALHIFWRFRPPLNVVNYVKCKTWFHSLWTNLFHTTLSPDDFHSLIMLKQRKHTMKFLIAASCTISASFFDQNSTTFASMTANKKTMLCDLMLHTNICTCKKFLLGFYVLRNWETETFESYT